MNLTKYLIVLCLMMPSRSRGGQLSHIPEIAFASEQSGEDPIDGLGGGAFLQSPVAEVKSLTVAEMAQILGIAVSLESEEYLGVGNVFVAGYVPFEQDGVNIGERETQESTDVLRYSVRGIMRKMCDFCHVEFYYWKANGTHKGALDGCPLKAMIKQDKELNFRCAKNQHVSIPTAPQVPVVRRRIKQRCNFCEINFSYWSSENGRHEGRRKPGCPLRCQLQEWNERGNE